jgi:hypothetical protein
MLHNLFCFFKFWMMTKIGEIRKDDECMDHNKDQVEISQRDRIVTWYCHGDNGPYQKWAFEKNMIRHVNSSRCMELLNDANHSLVMRTCDEKNENQLWQWIKPVKPVQLK